MILYVPITFKEIPIELIIKIADSDYTLSFDYNKRFDFISLAIYKEDVLLYSTKIIYGSDCGKYTEIPTAILPLTIGDLYKNGFSNLLVNKDTFGKTVLLF